MNNTTTSAQTSQRVSSQDSKKHFLRNTVSNVIFFVFNAVTSLIMVPYVKNKLGWESFGLIGVSQQIVSYTQILTVVLMATASRFVTMSLARDNLKEARDYFNTQFLATLLFCLVFLPISAVISYYTPAILKNVPPDQHGSVQILFFMVYVSFLITLMANPYKIGQFVTQRFDLKNTIELVNQVMRYGIWILLFWLFAPNMWQIGTGYVVGAVALLIGTVISFYKLTPELRPCLNCFSRAKFAEMTRMGSWLVVGQVGVVLYLSVDLLIINQMIGPEMTGKYSAVLGLAMQLRYLSSTMCGLVVPVAIAAYAREDWSALVSYMSRAVKFVSLGMAIPLGIFCGFADPFITRWLGEPELVATLTPLIWLLLAHNVINCGVEPLFALNTAANKVAWPGVVTVFGGVVKVVLSVALVKYTDLGIYGVALAGMVSLTLKNSVFTPLYSGRILKRPSWSFFRALIPSLFVFAATAAVSILLARSIHLASYPRLLMGGLFVTALASVAVYCLVLNADDKAFLKRLKGKSNEVTQD